MNWRIIYFSERVRSDVLALPSGIRADYLRLAELMEEHGADLRMPHSKAMGSGLFELRPKGPEGIGRVFYCKKTQKTPNNELEIAIRRMKEVKNAK
jgi:phage-related protein